ncbi:MAG: FAD-dependent oxidoreductase [Alphaproteobacteria bacterium]|jgi:4-methylaminobutanoate oxidase (formaldehyde-forming)|nr:FAD-dependent oxidoreductase [Alphaproteobacteria bacterium]
MSQAIPSQARVVIAGGGIIGCSIAYHLAKLGWQDVVLLERGHLTSGTTWHAAGLVNQLRASHTLTQLSRYGVGLYQTLEAETGQATGFQCKGSMPIARTDARLTEIRRMAALGDCFGVEAYEITPREVEDLWPLMDVAQIKGAIFIPGDGQVNPVDTTMALAKGARANGARIVEEAPVTAVHRKNGRVTGVATEQGDIACEYVVNCAGIWAREIGLMAGVNVPLYAAEHMYIVTEPIEGLAHDLPIVRDTDGCIYVKEDAGRLLVGCFEPVSKPVALDKLPLGAEFIELPEDWDQFEMPMQNALELIPSLKSASIRQFLNGPESFTPDNKFIMGEAPELRNFFVAAGFNSQGILNAAGAGKVLSEWILEGQPSIDLAELDIARFGRFQNNRRYLAERTRESLGLLFQMHWPYRQVETARPVRLSPLHARHIEHNACFGEAVGWERANWFAPAGVAPRYEYAYGRQNWFDYVRAEHGAVRNNVGLLDMSSFAKYLVQGPDAERELQRICANDVAVANGKLVYTQLLNRRGGIEADLTVTRLAEDRYLVITAAASQTRDFNWIERNIEDGARVYLTDTTSGSGVLAVMGPKSRELLGRVSDADFSNAAFPFASSQEIDMGYARALAMRITYVGELGWELHLATEFMVPVFDRLLEAGADLGLKLCGMHAMDSLRSEKGYRHWGHDITPAETPLEAGLGFAVAFKKKVDFIGREALERQRETGLSQRLVHVMLQQSDPLMFHDETIYRDGAVVGRITSAAFGYGFERPLGMGYIETANGMDGEDPLKGRFEVDIAGERVPATISLKPFYDPKSERVRL